MSKKTVDLERATTLVLVGLLLIFSLFQTFQITEFKTSLTSDPVVINTQGTSSQASTSSASTAPVATASAASQPTMVGGC